MEISAVSCLPQDPRKYYSNLVAVSFWASNCVEIFSIERSHPRLKSLCKTSALASIPRSLLFYDFCRCVDGPENHVHLLVGLGNGTIVSFAMKHGELINQKSVPLGGAPVCMTAYDIEGRPAVFASGGMTSIFFWDKNRLQNSPIVFKVRLHSFFSSNLKSFQDVAAASSLNTRTFASCLILATVSGLFIGKAGQLNQLHIQSVCDF